MSIDIEVYHLNYGQKIELDCKCDVSSVTKRAMLIKNAAGTVIEVDCTLGSTNNYIRYIVPKTSSPITAGQRYFIRSKIEFNANRKQQGDIVELIVGESWTPIP